MERWTCEAREREKEVVMQAAYQSAEVEPVWVDWGHWETHCIKHTLGLLIQCTTDTLHVYLDVMFPKRNKDGLIHTHKKKEKGLL